MNKKCIEIIFIRSWWVILFSLLCLLVYEHGLKQREGQYQQLSDHLKLLRLEKIDALKKQQNLQRQVNSQSDLAWVELTLMKGLGLTPEDQQKVYFSLEKPLMERQPLNTPRS